MEVLTIAIRTKGNTAFQVIGATETDADDNSFTVMLAKQPDQTDFLPTVPHAGSLTIRLLEPKEPKAKALRRAIASMLPKSIQVMVDTGGWEDGHKGG